MRGMIQLTRAAVLAALVVPVGSVAAFAATGSPPTLGNLSSTPGTFTSVLEAETVPVGVAETMPVPMGHGDTATISVPKGAFSSAVEIVAATPTNESALGQALIKAGANGQAVVTALGVEFSANGTPVTPAKPVTVTFNNTSIAVGDHAYLVTPSGAQPTSATITKGTATFSVTQDPALVLTGTVASGGTSGSGSGSGTPGAGSSGSSGTGSHAGSSGSSTGSATGSSTKGAPPDQSTGTISKPPAQGGTSGRSPGTVPGATSPTTAVPVLPDVAAGVGILGLGTALWWAARRRGA